MESAVHQTAKFQTGPNSSYSQRTKQCSHGCFCPSMDIQDCWKWRNCWLTTFSSLPRIFTRALFPKVLKILQGRLTFSINKAVVFTSLHYKSFENAVGKGEIARYEQFLLFPQCFPSLWRTFCHFH